MKTQTAHLLLLEDDLGLVDGLRYALEKEGYTLTLAHTVEQANIALGGPQQFDLLVLDVTLPDGTGFSVCDRVRQAGNTVPIIFLTAADEELSVVRGLDSGGDDYITKPFKLQELLSRIRALLRRAGQTPSRPAAPEKLRCGALCIDLMQSRVTLGGAAVELTHEEYRLLCLLVQNAGQTVTRAAILDVLWDGNGSFVDDNTLSVYIRRLREKLESDPSAPAHLLTVRGFGYRWKE
jgi:two-component system response regulator RegX3